MCVVCMCARVCVCVCVCVNKRHLKGNPTCSFDLCVENRVIDALEDELVAKAERREASPRATGLCAHLTT